MSKPIDQIIQSFTQDIQRAYVSTKLEGGHNFCPNCKESYVPTFPTKEEAFATDDLTAREQWLTGICSDKCWDKYLGVA